MPWLINAAQTDKFRKSQKSLLLLDASLHMPNTGRDAKKEFEEKHIPSAKFFDIELFSDPKNPAPHTLIQDEKLISEKLGSLGIRNDYKIIFYDNSDLHSAYRALWMMKVFGHNPNQLYILDGGLAAWEKYTNKIESGNPSVMPRTYKAKFQANYLRTLQQMKKNLETCQEQIIDLRHPVRFAGGKEPRPNMRQGHIPGSHCFPFTNLFEKNSSSLLPLDKIKKLLESVAINPNLPSIMTCGSGITAPILDFIFDLMNKKAHGVYDGSWSEWGSDKLYEGEKSLDERPIKTVLERDIPDKIA
jgi:thiosulfate/3-mercaptopyruvate sulfurtransferase